MTWYTRPAADASDTHRQQALQHQTQLTKPPGSLGDLEQLAVTLAALQGTDRPGCERVCIDIFAADHGIADEGVSAFPQEVTTQMVLNFASGGAAISVLARTLGATLSVTNAGTRTTLPATEGVLDARIAPGTANFAKQPAMSEAQLEQALQLGQQAIERAESQHCQLWIGGEMGIANTTSATALACALLSAPAAQLVGPGTGLDSTGQQHKAAVIDAALAKHQTADLTPLQQLQTLGGFESAALCGAYIAAAQAGIPALVDGFICTVAARFALALNPSIRPWLLLSHYSAEPGHQHLLETFQHPPLLSLKLRLGEASGAATAVPLLRLACQLHNEMATFAQAGVSSGD